MDQPHNPWGAPRAPALQSPSLQGHVQQLQMAGSEQLQQGLIWQPGDFMPQEGLIWQPGDFMPEEGLVWQPEDLMPQEGLIWQPGDFMPEEGLVWQPEDLMPQEGLIWQPEDPFVQQGWGPYVQQGWNPYALGYYPIEQGQTSVHHPYASPPDCYLPGYVQRAPMQPPEVYQMTPPHSSHHEQIKQTSHPHLTLQQYLPQPQLHNAQPTFVRIKAEKYLDYTNLDFMFRKSKVLSRTIQGGYAYVEFASVSEADAAKTEYGTIFEVIVGVGPPSGCPNKSASNLMLGSTEDDVSSEENKVFEENDRPSAHILMGWTSFLDFLSEKNTYLVEPQKFSTAANSGSVSPSVEMAKSTPYGNRFATGFLHYMGQVHLAGKSFAGDFKPSDLVVSSTSLCMIDKFPCSSATYLNVAKDLLAIIKNLFNLYEINGRKPAYFDDLLEKLRNPPTDMGSLVSYMNDLRNFYTRLVNHAAFADEKALCTILQEINVNCTQENKTNKTSIDSEFPTGSSPTDLAKFVKIDKLLSAVFRKAENTFSQEGEFLRHFVNHASEKYPDFLPLKERIALLGWYFEKFMPLFVDVMFENKGNRGWLQEQWQLYKKQEFELGAMPFHEICSLMKESVYPARQDVTGAELGSNLSRENVVGNLGTGLRNKPGENNCFLNVTVQVLFHVKLFSERLLNMDDLSGHPIVHELSLLFKALMAANEQPGEILSVEALRTALGNACPKECFEEGSVHEASLALKLILDSVHLALVSEPHATSDPCSCTAHDIFGLDGMEWTDCPCGSVSKPLRYESFSVSVNATSLLKNMKDRQNDSFGNHLKEVLMEFKFNCVDGCEKKTHLTRALLALPSVYTIEIEWRPGDEDVETVMNAMLSGIDLGAIYAYLGGGTIHRPVSMVSFSGMHYVYFTLQENVWVMFNDLKVKAIGSWDDLVSKCVADGWKPTLVFFQRSAVSPSRNTTEKHEQEENRRDPESNGTSAPEIASRLTHSKHSQSQMEISPLKGGDATGSPDGDSDHSKPSHSQVQTDPPEGGLVPDGLEGEASQEQICRGESETREASSSAEVGGGGN